MQGAGLLAAVTVSNPGNSCYMSVNKYKPHVLVLPEDDADRQIANGFILEPNLNQRNIDILRPSGGWPRVVEDFTSIHALDMQKLPVRMMVLLIDFDERDDRLEKVKQQIPEELSDRVFILGVWSNPEKLKQSIGKLEYGQEEDGRWLVEVPDRTTE